MTSEQRLRAQSWIWIVTGTVAGLLAAPRGPKNIPVIDPPEGRCTARSRNAPGYLPGTSEVVRLRR
jgi:hypothetical protein